MAFCTTCGAQLGQGARFCSCCGGAVASPVAAGQGLPLRPIFRPNKPARFDKTGANNCTQTRLYAVPLAEILSTLPYVIGQAGYSLTFLDPGAGCFNCTSSMTITSWGSNIFVQTGTDPDGDAWVTIASRAKFGLVDWGHSLETTNTIFKTLETVLQSRR